MTKQPEALIAEMKAAAEKATPLQLDTAQLKRGNDGWIECPCCEGAGDVEAEIDFCNIDGKALGVQFYGIGEHHGLAEQYFRQASPANVLALIAALEQAQQRVDELENDEVRQQLANAEHQLHMAELAKYNLRTSRRAQFRKRLAAEKRIAALEASPLAVKLHKRSVGEVMHLSGFSRDYAEGWCAGNDNAIHEIRAAGGTVEGE